MKCTRTVDDDCDLELKCEDCVLEALSSIIFTSKEFLAYAGSIYVKVETESSIPDEISFVDYLMEPDSRDFAFKGAEKTIFSFVAIPSIFESELSGEPSVDKGYHMALGTNNAKGSQSQLQNLSSVGFLNVEIQFEQGIAALHTKREYKERWLTLIMSMLGSIAGLIGAFGAAMRFVEKRWIQYRSYKKKDEDDKRFNPNRYLIEYYDDVQSRN